MRQYTLLCLHTSKATVVLPSYTAVQHMYDVLIMRPDHAYDVATS